MSAAPTNAKPERLLDLTQAAGALRVCKVCIGFMRDFRGLPFVRLPVSRSLKFKRRYPQSRLVEWARNNVRMMQALHACRCSRKVTVGAQP